jgi:hypothetical protein
VVAQITKIYDGHHARGLTGVQVAFAPAAIAVATIVARGAHGWVFAVAGGLLVVSVLIGIWRLSRVNRMHREYLLALALGKALEPFHPELEAYRNDAWFGADRTDSQAVGATLYEVLEDLTMLRYSVNDDDQRLVRAALREMRIDNAPLT